ncbi:tyrosine-type recombinase/integrase [Flavobacterium sp. LHD-85]|uniref:tyrosine-type recombinase/integrase n=1 Tax=Flavobacterium sp. LHD-85 TaxID=3071410 RepID=UPI0027E1950C|nr:tyrosine-type recombinase/integrase [Flavobacterium sp. LHD-85]MDQ6530100.1 tyrosine-type recombinase/integrase [Flavobacterium sp. LHD-85]MDQ6530342.1 tyrosine-type recombinase/integrase [Flavobacterium sp. LHD-85]
MNSKPIDELIQSCLQSLNETSYNREVTMAHKRRFTLLKSFMVIHSKDLYSEVIGESFKLSFLETNSLSGYKFKSIKSSVNLLNDVLNNIPMRRKRINRKVYQFPGEIGEQILSFLKVFKEKERIADKTFFKHSRNLSYFAVRMYHDQIDLHNLNGIAIKEFTSSLKNSKLYVCVSLRHFLNYLYERKLTDIDLRIPLNQIKRKSSVEKLPSVYSLEEIRQMDNAINRSKTIGKRNYAIFLLASRLGLRASDICSLQFGNLDWNRNTIRFEQYKTGQDIELPLLPVVGEAIIDYICYGRPKSQIKTIFLSGIAPFGPVSAANIFAIINEIISKSKVETNSRHHGSHSLRHSLASQLLEQGTTLAVISDSLGHSSSESTMFYLGIDVKGLLACSLEVPLVQEKFYIQKEGGFYE